MRAFIGIPLREEGAAVVAALGENLDQFPHFSAFRRVPPANVHLTLRFLGEISDDQAAAAAGALASACAGARAFSFALERLGAFPRPGSPSVLWAGPAETPPALARLAGDLESALATSGFEPEDRPFRPHLTLARRRRRERVPKGLAAALREAEEARLRPPPFLEMREAVLFQSELRPGGAVYTALHTASLSGG